MVAELLCAGGVGFAASEEGLYSCPLSLERREVLIQDIPELRPCHLIGAEAREEIFGTVCQTNMLAPRLQFLDLLL